MGELEKIEEFIENGLVRKLKKDQLSLKILSEGDLQSCAYYHLRKFLDKNKMADYYLTNKLSVGNTNQSKTFPDLAIVQLKDKGRKVKPRFFIELKEDRIYKKRRIKNDINKLKKYVKKYLRHIQQAYFIYAIADVEHSAREINEEIDNLKSGLTNYQKQWYVKPITINILAEKKYGSYREKKFFEEKYNVLRKFRN